MVSAFWWNTEVKPVLNGTEEDFVKSEGSISLEYLKNHPFYDDYWKAKAAKLEEITDASDRALQKAKMAVILWSKTHSLLAAGEPDPTKYDFMSVAHFVFSYRNRRENHH
jgi:hypothetical protein